MNNKKYIIGQDCFDALERGETLVENHCNYTVHLDIDGKQVISNPNRNRKYKFDNPNTWSILNKDNMKCIIVSEPENRFIKMLKDIFWIS